MIAALVGALLLLVGEFWRTIRADMAVVPEVGGRHRLSREHPGWETAIEDLYALQPVRDHR